MRRTVAVIVLVFVATLLVVNVRESDQNESMQMTSNRFTAELVRLC